MKNIKIENLIIVGIAVQLAIVGGIGYIAFHFITKFW